LNKGVQIIGSTQAGKTLQYGLHLQNNSGRILDVFSVASIALIPTDDDPSKRGALEDQVWAKSMETMRDAVEQQMPSSPALDISRLTTVEPMDDVTVQKLADGYFSYYMFLIIDAKSKREILGACGYLNQDKTFTLCRRHNFP